MTSDQYHLSQLQLSTKNGFYFRIAAWFSRLRGLIARQSRCPQRLDSANHFANWGLVQQRGAAWPDQPTHD